MPPATDQKIAQRYTVGSLEKKERNKSDLQEELGWPEEKRRAVICIPSGMSDNLGGALLETALPGLLGLDAQFLILGKGSSRYGALFTDLAKKNTHRIAIIPNDEISIRRMYAASDIATFFTNPENCSALPEAMSYGVVPIAPATGALDDYSPVQESGNAFLYSDKNAWSLFSAAVRALETFKLPFDWKTIQRHCMESVK